MQPTGYFIDTNLFLLLIVGHVDRRKIGMRRLRSYTMEDYDILRRNFINKVDKLLVTPNILTETSNLLRQIESGSRMLDMLQSVIKSPLIKEIPTVSKLVSCRKEFNRLGLTDTALLEVITPKTPLITDDLILYQVASQLNPEIAINFTYQKAID